MRHHVIRLTEAEAGQRLDRYLRKLLQSIPLGAIMKHLRSGRIRVDGKKAQPSLRLEASMDLELDLPAADLDALAAAPLRRTSTKASGAGGPQLRVIFEDSDVLVIHKPSGLAVHPGSGNEHHSVVGWLDSEGRGRARGLRTATFAPSPAHRLDRGTSGLVAIGLTPAGLSGLTAAFRDGTVRKVYLAVVEGVPKPERGAIEAPLLAVESGSSRDAKVRVDAAGKPARTDYEVLEQKGDQALLRLQPRTGRTHQIRAHLAHIGHPILGDGRYGRGGGRSTRLMLHATELEFCHPVGGDMVRCVDPLPPDFAPRFRRGMA